MLDRILEPEVMDTEEDANEYAAFNHSIVNSEFVSQAIQFAPIYYNGKVIDIGTGPGDIAILLAQRMTALHVVAIDLGEHMLKMATDNVVNANLSDRVEILKLDAKATGFAPASFDMVICNSLVHHIPDPLSLFAEIKRITKPGAGIFIKDLKRPETKAELQYLVDTYAAGCSPYQRRIFGDSLHAALTAEEVKDMCDMVGLTDVKVEVCSDRHWSISRRYSH